MESLSITLADAAAAGGAAGQDGGIFDRPMPEALHRRLIYQPTDDEFAAEVEAKFAEEPRMNIVKVKNVRIEGDEIHYDVDVTVPYSVECIGMDLKL